MKSRLKKKIQKEYQQGLTYYENLIEETDQKKK